MSDEHKPAFERDVAIAEPGLVGARWWNRALQDEAAAMSRRSAMRNLLVGAGVLDVVAACGVGIVASVQPDTEERLQASLAAQRLYGWNLGARDRALLYEGFALQLQVPSMLSSLIVDTTPHTWVHLLPAGARWRLRGGRYPHALRRNFVRSARGSLVAWR